MHKRKIKNPLHFSSSPENVVSVGKLSLKFGDNVSTRDRGTWNKMTYDTFWLTWDRELFQHTIQHLVSGLPETIVNELDLDKKHATLFTNIMNYFTKVTHNELKECQHVALVSPNMHFNDANDNHETVSNDSPEFFYKDHSLEMPRKYVQSIGA